MHVCLLVSRVEVLEQCFCEQRPWKPLSTPTTHLLVDARSTPPRVAAVLLIDRKILWSDWAPEPEVLSLFQSRRDGQIMSLELLSIAFGCAFCFCCVWGASVYACISGLDSFAEHIKGRNVHVHSDNTGAQHTTQKGVARTFDHTCLVHGIWYVTVCSASVPVFVLLRCCRLRALELGIGLYVSRVPTHENLSDNPSREEYEVLQRLGAVFVQPHLSRNFRQVSAWEALSIRQREDAACKVAQGQQ